MIKIIFLVIVIIHGFIHLLGFMKAFNLMEIKELALNISRAAGIFWLFTAVMFLATIVLFLFNKNWWWTTGIVAVVCSQILIISSWQDAKFGTILNIIILIAIILGFASWNFNNQIDKEINSILSRKKVAGNAVVTEQMINELPVSVKKWLNNAGVIGKEKIHSVYLRQKGKMRLKPGQKWTKAEAEQYITIDNPAFLWKVEMQMMPFVNVTGRDFFFDGKGNMLMKIASLIPVASVGSNVKVNQASLQRYLAELPWYPSGAISPYIKWKSIDNNSAEATMSYKGVTGSVTFHFDKNGNLNKIWAMRYKDSDEKAQLKEWIGEVKEINKMNGIKIPTKLDISWVLNGEIFTWYKLKITDIEYNKSQKILE